MGMPWPGLPIRAGRCLLGPGKSGLCWGMGCPCPWCVVSWFTLPHGCWFGAVLWVLKTPGSFICGEAKSGGGRAGSSPWSSSGIGGTWRLVLDHG